MLGQAEEGEDDHHRAPGTPTPGKLDFSFYFFKYF
jgi:hypothetical protein